jgi:hypothetical protein
MDHARTCPENLLRELDESFRGTDIGAMSVMGIRPIGGAQTFYIRSIDAPAIAVETVPDGLSVQ